jgi:hypothetical protein
MSNRCTAAALAAILGLVITGCSAAVTGGDAPTATSSERSGPGTTGTTGTTGASSPSVPAATGGTTSSGSGATGPGEKEGQRGNTPPGVSRDGAGPAAGAIVDPSGAATGKR